MKSRFPAPEIRKFVTRLCFAETPEELEMIEQTMGDSLYGINAIVSLPGYEEGSYLELFKFPFTFTSNYVVCYFKYPNFYFINHEMVQRVGLAIDYSISFDSNAATYIKTVVKTKTLEGLRQEVKETFDEILYNNLNYDYLFYFVENIKVVYPLAVKMKRRGISQNPPSEKNLGVSRSFGSTGNMAELFSGG